ncbi:MAG: hypothetical protein QY321_00215 [Patescibacteria group bacterium]|nr:MAG: hypothetical protein QY321_00215 [Patescibacteria group bacterium]
MLRKSPKVLFVDWHKTLSHSFFWSQLSDKNHPYNNYHQIIDQWLFKKNSTLVEKWMLGFFTAEQICQKISVENNLNEKIIYYTLKESCENMQLCSKEIIGIINKLRKTGIKVIIATDNMDTFRRFTIKKLGLDKIFDDFLISSELQTLKYNISNNTMPFFDTFLKENQLQYSDAVLLDDSEEKSGVYKKLGFEISLIKNNDMLINHLKSFFI